MIVKSILKMCKEVEFNLVDENGNLIKTDYIGDKYFGEGGLYEYNTVISITNTCDEMIITIKR